MKNPTLDYKSLWRLIPESYILDCIEDEQGIEYAFNCFKAEYVFPANVLRYGTNSRILSEWLMGLPTALTVDLANFDIIQRAKEWKIIRKNASENTEDELLENWFRACALRIIAMRFNTKYPESVNVTA